MTFPITAAYAAPLALLMVALQLLAIIARGRTGVLFGDAGRMELVLPVRRHGNFIENVPMVLILMALAEAQGLSAGWLHASGLMLCAGRLIQPLGLSESRKALPLRVAGTVGTWIALAIPVVALLAGTIAG
ncbi:MAPEG family protein [Frigidibacter sp. RF13]|uniref:MAPEG family protein n=1 Tax=Frigidibacter sp. RF13 TaxID=2997340 RepID=UPI0022718C20|nr:MAPEG family protein [Frigidibacter sp. RF13]MCY1127877.1 MAPEG family protein [Frigidibacter sp. RF13]